MRAIYYLLRMQPLKEKQAMGSNQNDDGKTEMEFSSKFKEKKGVDGVIVIDPKPVTAKLLRRWSRQVNGPLLAADLNPFIQSFPRGKNAQ